MSVLNAITTKQKRSKGWFYRPITITELNETQKDVLREVNKNTITTVYGAAGTGKTQTIVNLVAEQLRLGKKVLVVSKMNKAVDVISDRLNELIGDFTAVRAGDRLHKAILANKLMDIVAGKARCVVNSDNKMIKSIQKKRNIALQLPQINTDVRKQLILQATMLIEKKRKKTTVSNFEAILDILPCWCVTTMQISECLPLIENLFDVVIIDEASQCDIASCIPCLFRAKKAVVIGDDKQLRHLSFLEMNKEQSFMTKNGVPFELQYIWRYRTNSIFDFANFYADKSILLNVQYRSPANIMEFSNKEFYNGAIQSYKPAVDGAISKVLVNGGMTDGNISRNKKEAEAIIKKVKSIIKSGENKTVGILSPFRAQCDLIEKMLMAEVSLEDIEKHKIIVGTAHAYQGGQKQTMLISWCYADNSTHQSLSFLNTENLFNVAITRGQEQVINYYSTNNMRDCLLKRYLESIK